MKKKYKCRLSATSLLINVKGNVLRLEFEPDVINAYGLRGCSYSTDKKDVQHEIEHNKRFGLSKLEGIWTDDVEPVKKEVVPQAGPVTVPQETEKKEEATLFDESTAQSEEAAIEGVTRVRRARRAKKEE